MMSLALLGGAGLITEGSQTWWKNFTDKCLKFLLITTNLSQELWNEVLVKDFLKKKIQDIGVEEFRSFYVLTKQNDGNKICVETVAHQQLGQLTQNETISIESCDLTLKDLLCCESEQIDPSHKMAIKFIGSVLISGHLLQYHRLPNQTGFLIPTVVPDLGHQQNEVVECIRKSVRNDVRVRKILMGEGGTGKTYLCFNLSRICLNELNFKRVIYAVPQNKKALWNYVRCKMLQDYGYEKSEQFKLCTISNVEDNFPKYRSVTSKYALIVDECLASSRDELLKILKPVYGLLPFFDVVVICMSIMGQLECSLEYFDHNTLGGFHRRVLTVGYRSTRNIAMFNSHYLHTNTKKHFCGTSCCVVPANFEGEATVEIVLVSSNTNSDSQAANRDQIISEIKNWSKNVKDLSESSAIICFTDNQKRSKQIGELAEMPEIGHFFHSLEDKLMDLSFTGCDREHVLVILESDQDFLTRSQASKFLAATTRAQKTLTIIVTNEKLQKLFIGIRENAEKEHLMFSAPNGNADEIVQKINRSNHGDYISIFVQKEDTKTLVIILSKLAEMAEKAPLIQDCAIKIFNHMIGKRRSAKFLEEMFKLFAESVLNLQQYLDDPKVVHTWFETAYERGYTHTIEKFKPILKPSVDNDKYKPTSENNLIHQACFNGARENIEHALDFAKNEIGLDQERLRSWILDKLFITFGASRRESLLTLTARTNMDKNCVTLLIYTLKLHEKPLSDNERESFRDTFRVCILQRSYTFIRAMIEINESYFELFREALYEFERTMDEDRKEMEANQEGDWCEWVDNLKRKIRERNSPEQENLKRRKMSTSSTMEH